MALRTLPKKFLGPIVAILIVVSYVGYQQWQGPRLAGVVVEQAALVQRVVAAGRVTNEARVQISSEVAGLVVERAVKEGQRVVAGEVLVRLQAKDVEAQLSAAKAAYAALAEQRRPQAQAEVQLAASDLAQAQRERERREALLAAELLNQEAVEQARRAETAAETRLTNAKITLKAVQPEGVEAQQLQAQITRLQAQLSKATIVAPAAGRVLTRTFEVGDVVQPSQVLFAMAIDSAVEVRAPLDERNLSQLALGQPAEIIADAYPSQSFNAMVSYIAPAIDPQRGTVEVRLLVNEPPSFVRQDMTVSVTIETARKDSALVVPNEAIFAVQGIQAQVWRFALNEVQMQQVTLGVRGLTQTEVIAGLRSGDNVLTEFDDTLEEGKRIRFVTQSTVSEE